MCNCIMLDRNEQICTHHEKHDNDGHLKAENELKKIELKKYENIE